MDRRNKLSQQVASAVQASGGRKGGVTIPLYCTLRFHRRRIVGHVKERLGKERRKEAKAVYIPCNIFLLVATAMQAEVYIGGISVARQNIKEDLVLVNAK